MMSIVEMTRVWIERSISSETHLVERKRDIAMFDLLVGDQTAPRNHSATISSTLWLHTLPNDADYPLFSCPHISDSDIHPLVGKLYVQ